MINISVKIKQNSSKFNLLEYICYVHTQPRSQGLRGETVTKTLVKFILSFQNFAKKIACAVRHNRIAIQLNTVVSLRMRFFSQNFGTIKRILPGSSSPSHREGPGIEVGAHHYLIHLVKIWSVL